MNQRFKVLFFLKRGKGDNENSLPIYVRVNVDGKSAEWSVQRRCDSTMKWNQKLGRVNGTKEESKTLNAFLDAVQGAIFLIQKEYALRNESVTAEQVRSAVLGKKENQLHTIVGVYKYHNEQFEKLVGLEYSHGTYKKFKSALVSLEKFIEWKFKKRDVPLINDGAIIKGKIIQLSDNESPVSNAAQKHHFKGGITMSSLNRQNVLHSKILNGYIEAFHQQDKTLRTLSMADPYQTLPEVIIVSTITTSGVTYSTWASLLAIMDDGGTNNYYGEITYDYDTGGGGGGYTGGSTEGGGDGYIQTSPLSIVDMETQDTDPAIDINKFLKCFNAIPDAGATCSIEILTDIAVDNDPSVFLNWQTGSPGHVFLKLNKKNGSQSVQQIFGWYPTPGYKLMLNASPIDGKFVNNAYHEYNASIKFDISPSQLQTAITEVVYLSGFIRYDIDEYNCTDFALDVFNKAVSPYDRLEIPKYIIPGSNSTFGSSTPNGLYQQLQSIKNSGGHNADKIAIPEVKGFVGISNGPCN